MLRIKCPNCRQPVQIGLAQAGARTCPACGAAIDKLQLDEHVVRPDPPESGTKHRSASADQLVMAGAPNALDARIQAGDPAGQTPLADPEAGECFDAKPYYPEGGIAAFGLPMLLGAMVLGGLLVGLMSALLGQWLRSIILFPVAMGLGVFAAGYVGAWLGKVRNGAAGAVAGVLGGVVTILALHYFSYLLAVNQVRGLYAADRASLRFSAEAFLRFVDLKAQEGVRLILYSTPEGTGVSLGYAGSYIYWLIELAIVIVVGVAGTKFAAAQPFCGRCKNWKEKRRLGTFGVPSPYVIGDLQLGAIWHLAKCAPTQRVGPLVLTAAVCTHCTASDIDITLHEIAEDEQGKKRRRELLRLSYASPALAAFERVFRRERPD